MCVIFGLILVGFFNDFKDFSFYNTDITTLYTSNMLVLYRIGTLLNDKNIK